MMDGELIVFTGNANRPLAQKITSWLDQPLGEATVTSFSDGETRVELHTNVRGRDVFIIQPISRPANHHLMEAMIMADACVRSSAARVTLVAPYFGYARQERKSAPRTPITAKLVADLIQASHFDRVLTMELHTAAIQGFFNIPVDHLYAKPIFSSYFRADDSLVIVSPDAGGVERARAMAKHFNCGLAIIDKRRDKPNESAVMNIIGDVRGKNCLIIDDIVDTAGSMTKASDALLGAGAVVVRAAVSHAVLSGAAIDNLNKSSLKELVVTDTIQLTPEALACSKITQLSIAELFGKAIRRIHNDDSISALFI
jgi:ribose-phosphate pyrophosphokinase